MNKLTLRRIAVRICDTVFPRKCILCGELLDPDRGAEMCEKCLGAYSDALALTCPVCGKGAKSCRCRCGASPDTAELTVLGFYTGADSDIGRLVYRFKREYDRDIRKFFARSLAAALSSDIGKDISDFTVTFPPRSRDAERKYGFDQSERLASLTAEYIGAGFDAVFIRSGGTDQKKLSAAMRRANVSDAFRLKSGAKVAGKRFILIDDIITTGSTVEKCESLLLEAGAAEVHPASLFRTMPKERKEKVPPDSGLWFEY